MTVAGQPAFGPEATDQARALVEVIRHSPPDFLLAAGLISGGLGLRSELVGSEEGYARGGEDACPDWSVRGGKGGEGAGWAPLRGEAGDVVGGWW